MPLRKTLWDQLHIWERGIGKQCQTCKLESRFNLFQTKLNLLLWVFPKAWPVAFFFFFPFRFCLTVEMFCLNPEF